MELSNRSNEVGKYIEIVKDLPDLRTDRINQLRERILSGNYHPSGEEIADAIWKYEKI